MMGPVLAVTQTLAKVRMRALAAALVALIVNVIGAASALSRSESRATCSPLPSGRVPSDMPYSYLPSLRCLELRSVSIEAHGTWRRSSSALASEERAARADIAELGVDDYQRT